LSEKTSLAPTEKSGLAFSYEEGASMNKRVLVGVASAAFAAAPSTASIVFSTTDHDAWFNAVEGPITTIGFSEVVGQIVTEQYAFLGAHFTDGNDYGTTNPTYIDGFGIKGHIDSNASPIVIEFDISQYWVSASYTGFLQFTLYDEERVVGSSFGGFGPIGLKFHGIISSVGFSKVVISSPGGLPFVDDLHFGTPIPAAAPLGLLMLIGAMDTRRSRNGR
jgi:hypothetical protein